MSNKFNTYPTNNNCEEWNVITQADPPSPLSNIPLSHPEDPPVSQTPPMVLAPDIIACYYKALQCLNLSNFEYQQSSISQIGTNTEIKQYNPVLVPIIGGYKRFIKTASERVCSALAFIVNYDYLSIDFPSIQDLPPIQDIIPTTFFANIYQRSCSLNTWNWGSRKRLPLACLAPSEWKYIIFFFFVSSSTTTLFCSPFLALYQTIVAIRKCIFVLFILAKKGINGSCCW